MLSAEQHRIRRRGLGGSDMTALAGLSKRWRPIDVWLSKVGETPGPSTDEKMCPDQERGIFLEPGVRSWYAHRTGCWVEETGTLVHPDHRLVLATPDGVSHFSDGRPDRAFEIKCPNFFKARDWSQGNFPDDIRVPDYYLPQLLWEMAVLGTEQADVAVLLGDMLHVVTVPFDGQMYQMLRDLAESFWDHCVEPQVPPEPDTSESYQAFLKSRHPSVRKQELMPATPQTLDWARRLGEVSEQLDALEAERKQIQAQLKTYIADAQGIQLSEKCKVTWTNNRDKVEVDWRAVALELDLDPASLAAHTREVVDYEGLVKSRPVDQDLIKKHTLTRPGARVFRAQLKGFA